MELYTIARMPYAGLPVVVWLGIVLVLLVLIAGFSGYLRRKGIVNIPLKVHYVAGAAAVILGVVHAILGMAIYL